MISHIFSKTKPVNFIILSLLLALFVVSYEGFVGLDANQSNTFLHYFSQNIGFFIKRMGVLVPTLFLMDFVLKRNKIVSTHSYQLFYFAILTGLFTSVFSEMSLLLSHFAVLLGLRRVVSLKSKENTNRKIFEASLWFFVASYFYDWALLSFVVLFVGMVFFEKTSIRHWGLVIWSFIVFAVLLVAFAMGKSPSDFFSVHYMFKTPVTPLLSKFSTGVMVFLIIGIFILFWLITKNKSVKKSAGASKSHARLLFLFSIVGLFLYILHTSENSSREALIFMFFPFSFLLGQATAALNKTWLKEWALWTALSLPLWSLMAYLLQN